MGEQPWRLSARVCTWPGAKDLATPKSTSTILSCAIGSFIARVGAGLVAPAKGQRGRRKSHSERTGEDTAGQSSRQQQGQQAGGTGRQNGGGGLELALAQDGAFLSSMFSGLTSQCAMPFCVGGAQRSACSCQAISLQLQLGWPVWIAVVSH